MKYSYFVSSTYIRDNNLGYHNMIIKTGTKVLEPGHLELLKEIYLKQLEKFVGSKIDSASLICVNFLGEVDEI